MRDVEPSDGREQNPRPQIDGRMKQDIHQRGFQIDFLGAVLEFQLRGEFHLIGNGRIEKNIKPSGFERQPLFDAFFSFEVGVHFGVAADGNIPAQSVNIGTIIHAADHMRRLFQRVLLNVALSVDNRDG